MNELPPRPSVEELDEEPKRTHIQAYDHAINAWWCFNCNNVTDFCTEANGNNEEGDGE